MFRYLTIGLLLITCCGTAIANEPKDFRKKLDAFAVEMANKHKLDPEQTRLLLRKAKYRQKIIDAITRPAESLSWARYRPIFLSSKRANAGVKFWKENQALLNRAEKEYGVAPEIIVAIIGVETHYGRHKGRYPVIDALATLGFAYPKRSKFFKRQLEEFLLMSKEHGVTPQTAKGSYAGAMGQPQFIPSSYRAYAVDFDGDGKTDLWNSNADVIGSVAAYFSRHRWKTGQPITFRAKTIPKSNPHYVKSGQRTAKPGKTVSTLRSSGIQFSEEPSNEELATLLHLKGAKGSEFWVALHNFYVITRYNHSNLYAMAVYQLSREILDKYQATQ